MKIERNLHSRLKAESGKWKRIFLLLLVSPFTFHLSPLSAQTSMLSIGVRGGGQTYLPTAAVGATGEVKPGIGGTGALDVRYTYYGSVASQVQLGVAVGAGFGYGTTGIKGTNMDSYTNIDYLGNKMDYSIDATYSLKDQFAKVDVSLLLAMRFGRVTLNVGPRFMLPFAASSALTIRQSAIDAYYPAYNVHVTDQLITGKLTTPYTLPHTAIIPRYSLLVAAEIGYEWSLSGQSALGLQLYADVGVWNSAGKNPAPITPLIQVSPITSQENPVPTVTVGDIAPMIKDLRYIDFGLRVYYAFSIESDKGYKSRFNTRNTRLHRNRYFWW
jgi:hypothetical protein